MRRITSNPLLVLGLGTALLATFGLAPVAHGAAKIGERAPDFSLPSSQDGKTVALKSLVQKNKAVVVLFIATHCPYSNGYNERMAQLSREYGKKGVAIVGINSNKTETKDEVARHAQKYALTFPVATDTGAKVADLYDAQHTPEAYVINDKGLLVYHGRIDDRYDDPKEVKSPDLRNALDAVLAGQPIKEATTKAFGCSIKR